MNGVSFARMALEQSKGWVMGLIDDMKDAPLTQPTPNGGNHPLWVLGHLAYSEGNLLKEFIEGKSNPLAEWKDLFGQGSTPDTDAGKYPSLGEIAEKFELIRGETLQLLDTLTDDDLDKPTHAPEEMKQFFGTIGQCLSAMAVHTTFHGGQVADARRAAGRPFLMG